MTKEEIKQKAESMYPTNPQDRELGALNYGMRKAYITGYTQALKDQYKRGEVPKDRFIVRFTVDGEPELVIWSAVNKWWNVSSSASRFYFDSELMPNLWMEQPKAPAYYEGEVSNG